MALRAIKLTLMRQREGEKVGGRVMVVGRRRGFGAGLGHDRHSVRRQQHRAQQPRLALVLEHVQHEGGGEDEEAAPPPTPRPHHRHALALLQPKQPTAAQRDVGREAAQLQLLGSRARHVSGAAVVGRAAPPAVVRRRLMRPLTRRPLLLHLVVGEIRGALLALIAAVVAPSTELLVCVVVRV